MPGIGSPVILARDGASPTAPRDAPHPAFRKAPSREKPIRRETSQPPPFRAGIAWAAAAALLLAFAVHAWASQRHKSPTVDEFAHVPAGYVGLATGRFDLYGKTPPLARTLFALPLLRHHPAVPDPPPGSRMAGWYPWTYATGFFNANLRQGGLPLVRALYRDSRLVVIGFSVLLGLGIFIWGRLLHGSAGGLLALALFTLDPNVLAHGRLATTDMAAALFLFMAVAALTAWLHRPGRLRLLLAGAAAGAALAVKFTAVLLLPVALGLAVARLLQAPAAERHALARRLALGLGGIAMLALLAVNAAYLFGGSLRPLGDYQFRSRALALAQQPWLGWLPVPLPADMVRGFDAQQVDVETGDFPNYFNGRWSRQGWWYYYPATWLLKTPLPLVALLLAALGLASAEALDWRRRRPHASRTGLPPGDPRRRLSAWALGLSIAIPLLAACFLNRLDIGIRYLLPIYPFVFVGAASLGRLLRRGEPVAAGLVLAGLLTTGFATLSTFPHYLAYANILAGGTERGWQVLSNSNNDWGQDLPALKAEMDRRGEPDLRLAYFGHAEPSAWGLSYSVPLPGGSGEDALAPGRGRYPYTFRPGLYAISANLLVGLPYQVMDHGRWVPAGTTLTEPQEIFAWFRKRAPDAVIGGSILLYRIEAPGP